MSQGKPAVLIVDDDPTAVEALKLALEDIADLTTATTAKECEEIASKQSFDLIVLDVDLPDLSGFELCRRLKASPQAMNTPIIFQSGYKDLIFEAQAFDAGCIDYLIKPVSAYRVQMRVLAHIKSRSIPM